MECGLSQVQLRAALQYWSICMHPGHTAVVATYFGCIWLQHPKTALHSFRCVMSSKLIIHANNLMNTYLLDGWAEFLHAMICCYAA